MSSDTSHPTTLNQRLASVPPLAWLLALTFLCLVPFINKAFHIDDTLFLRAAEQIRNHPANFYGFNINWFGTEMPMTKCFENPPLTCYYIALASWIAGWSEPALHLAFLVFALAFAWGTYALARNYCDHPLLAGIAAVLTPVFLISATTVMCDVMLAAFWVWSLVWFEKGLQTSRPGAFVFSGVLAGLAVLTKFPGLALVPLMAAYGLARQRRIGGWLIALVIPLLVAAAYEVITYKLYGHGLLLAAAEYSSENRSGLELGLLERMVLGLGYAGGCFLPVLFYAPLLWPRRMILPGVCLLGLCLILPFFAGLMKPMLHRADGSLNWVVLLQCAFFILSGWNLLLLITADFLERRDAVSFLLLCWTIGIMIFTVAVNWVMTGRSLLPMVPALGILVARRWERRMILPRRCRWFFWPALAAGAASLALARADYKLANSGRAAARELCAKYLKPGNTLWFEGHWGFQYYMERFGAKAVDLKNSHPQPEDMVVLPPDYSNVYDLPSELLRFVDLLEFTPNTRMTTMSRYVGAGFYAAGPRPLPYAIGNIAPESFYVFQFIWVSAAELAELQQPGKEHFTALADQVAITGRINRYEDYLRTHPDDADAHRQLGQLLISRSQIPEATAQLQEVLRLKPDDGPARLLVAELLDRQGETAEAIAQYRAVLRATPDSVDALTGLASMLATNPRAEVRNGAEAMKLAEHADELTSHKSDVVLTALAQACAEAGRFPDAVAAANKAIELAEAAGHNDLADANRAFLEFYRANRPYHADDQEVTPKSQ